MAMATLNILVATLTLVESSPIGNSTSSDDIAPRFVSQPQGRGTVGLLFSCIITLVLCVWTAIHHNIIEDRTPIGILGTRIIYVLLGLFTPEIVLAIAYREWREATKLLEVQPVEVPTVKPNEPLDEPPNESGIVGEVNTGISDAATGQPDGEERNPDEATQRLQEEERLSDARKTRKDTKLDFCMECSFFAVMGGYTLSPFRASDTFSQFTLSTACITFLLKHRLLSGGDLASLKGEIMDKGKADVLAKFLTCAQALWMMLCCLSRKIVGLPITLIEINVVVNLFCALSMYVFWLRKPHNAGRSIRLSPDILSDDISSILYTQYMYNNDEFSVSDELSGPEVPDESDSSMILSKNFVIKGRRYRFRLNKTNSSPETLTIYDRDHVTLAKACVALQDPKFKDLVRRDPRNGRLYITRDLSLSRIGRILPPIREIFWAIVPLSLAYGGVHATAWNSHFPSPIERQLWRISCVIIATPAFSICVVAVIGTLIFRFRWSGERVRPFDQDFGGGGRSDDGFRRGVLGVVLDPLLDFLEEISFDPPIIKEAYDGALKKFPWVGIVIPLLGLIAGITWTETHPYPTAVPRTLEILLAAIICFLGISIMVIASRNPKAGEHLPSEDDCPPWSKNSLKLITQIFLFIICFLQYMILWLLILLYVGARIFMIVESFISLRSLPKGAFKTVPWQDFWPHI